MHVPSNGGSTEGRTAGRAHARYAPTCGVYLQRRGQRRRDASPPSGIKPLYGVGGLIALCGIFFTQKTQKEGMGI